MLAVAIEATLVKVLGQKVGFHFQLRSPNHHH